MLDMFYFLFPWNLLKSRKNGSVCHITLMLDFLLLCFYYVLFSLTLFSCFLIFNLELVAFSVFHSSARFTIVCLCFFTFSRVCCQFANKILNFLVRCLHGRLSLSHHRGDLLRISGV